MPPSSGWLADTTASPLWLGASPSSAPVVTVALGSLSLVATSKRTTFGTSTISLGALSVTSVGGDIDTGTVALPLGSVTLAATGVRIVQGTATIGCGALSLTATGQVHGPTFWLNTQQGWQPWNIASAYQVASWDTETYMGGDRGVTPALNQTVLVATVNMGYATLKVWIDAASVQALG